MQNNFVAKHNYHRAVVIEDKKSKQSRSRRKQKHKGKFIDR